MKRHGLLEIHIAVILFGLSGLFGKLLTLPPLVIVFGRTFFAFLTLSIILAGFKIPFRVNSRRDFFVLILLGNYIGRTLDHVLSLDSDFHSCRGSAHIFNIPHIRHVYGAGFLQRKNSSFRYFNSRFRCFRIALGYSVIRFSKQHHPRRILGNPIGIYICRSIHIKSKIREHLSSDFDGLLPERDGNPDIASLYVF